MKNLNLTLIMLLVAFIRATTVSAQTDCAFSPTSLEYNSLDLQIQVYNNNVSPFNVIGGFTCDIPVRVYLVGKSDGTGALPQSIFNGAFQKLNQNFASLGIKFYVTETVKIFNNNLYYFDQAKESLLQNAYYKAKVINLYFVGDMSACGYAYLPSSNKDIVVINNSCAANGSTLTHELGHYFSLLHTHDTRYGREFVNGSNCSTAGDRICDTPADPGLSVVDNNCAYTGNLIDPMGKKYQPDTRNMMSYSQKHCRTIFSPEQKNRMLASLKVDRQYLLTCQQQRCNLATSLTCGSTVAGDTRSGANLFKREDYLSGYSSSSAFDGNDLLYQFSLQQASTVTIRLFNLSTDEDVFLMSACEPAKCIGFSVNSYSAEDIITKDLAAGNYYIVVDGYRPQENGYFNLNLTCKPKDDCYNAINLACGQIASNNTAYTTNKLSIYDYQSCYASNSNFAGNDLVYRLENQTNGYVHLRLFNLAKDLDIFLLDACKPYIHCVAYSVNSYNTEDEIWVWLPRGTYYAVVDGYQSYENGPFSLAYNCYPNKPDGVEERQSVADKAKPSEKVLAPIAASYPNLFEDQTTISFDVASAGPVSLDILDAHGSLVFRQDYQAESGNNKIIFVAQSNMPDGMYYYRLRGANWATTGKMILQRR